MNEELLKATKRTNILLEAIAIKIGAIADPTAPPKTVEDMEPVNREALKRWEKEQDEAMKNVLTPQAQDDLMMRIVNMVPANATHVRVIDGRIHYALDLPLNFKP